MIQILCAILLVSFHKTIEESFFMTSLWNTIQFVVKVKLVNERSKDISLMSHNLGSGIIE